MSQAYIPFDNLWSKKYYALSLFSLNGLIKVCRYLKGNLSVLILVKSVKKFKLYVLVQYRPNIQLQSMFVWIYQLIQQPVNYKTYLLSAVYCLRCRTIILFCKAKNEN